MALMSNSYQHLIIEAFYQTKIRCNNLNILLQYFRFTKVLEVMNSWLDVLEKPTIVLFRLKWIKSQHAK